MKLPRDMDAPNLIKACNGSATLGPPDRQPCAIAVRGR
jgi:hypothetical protein